MIILLQILAMVADTGLATVFEPLPLPPPGAVEFSSDWTSGLGGGSDAIRDGGIWPRRRDPGAPNLEVIAQPGAWWPAATAFQIIHNETAGYVFHDTAVPPPQVGEAVYHRFLFAQRYGPARNVIHNGNHGISAGAGTGRTPNCAASGGDVWTLRFGDLGRDGDTTRFMFGVGRRDYWDLRFDLDKERAYLIELALYRSGTATWQLHPRILDPLTGEVLAGAADFVNRNNRAATLGQGPNFTLVDPGCLSRVYMGTNGARGFSGVVVLAGRWATTRGNGLGQWIGL